MKKRKPLIVGLTGSIGMGKTTVARMFARLGFPVFSADEAVHALLAPGGAAVKAVLKLCPAAKRGAGVDRKKLGAFFTQNPDKLAAMEKIIHPLVWKTRDAFLKEARRNKNNAVILDIPLLFETGADKDCDYTLCVYAAKAVQKARVLKRKGMTVQKFKTLLAKQKPDYEKRRKADKTIRTDCSLAQTRAQVRALAATWK